MLFRRVSMVVIALSLSLAGCSGGYNGPYLGAPTPMPIGSLSLSSTSLAFGASGAAYAQSVTVSQPGYSLSFSASTTTCSGIASIASSGTTMTVTPIAPGHCTFAIAGGNNQTATLTIDVTTTTVGGS